MSKKTWTKRQFVGEVQLDELSDGSVSILKAFRKWWHDGSSCLDIMKYVRLSDGTEKSYHPVQHIQIVWSLATPFLKLFESTKENENEIESDQS